MPSNLRTPVAVTVATIAVLSLAVGAMHADGQLSTRAAWGALSGLGVGATVLALAALAVSYGHEVTADA